MKQGTKRVIDGHTYYLLHADKTKAEAERSAAWQRKGGFRARIEKLSRGHYRVWAG